MKLFRHDMTHVKTGKFATSRHDKTLVKFDSSCWGKTKTDKFDSSCQVWIIVILEALSPLAIHDYFLQWTFESWNSVMKLFRHDMTHVKTGKFATSRHDKTLVKFDSSCQDKMKTDKFESSCQARIILSLEALSPLTIHDYFLQWTFESWNSFAMTWHMSKLANLPLHAMTRHLSNLPVLAKTRHLSRTM